MNARSVDGLLVAAGATLMTLAFPPFTLVWPAFVCLVPAALLILRGSRHPHPWRWRLRAGFCYGLATYAVLLHWLAGALWTYGGGAIGLYLLAVVAFAAASALLFGIVGRITDASPGRLALALPAAVVALEWIAGHAGPLALPWHQLALTVAATPILLQSADLAGSAGVGFLLASISTLLALAWWERATPRRALVRIEVAGSVLFVMLLYGAHRMATVPLETGGSVAVVQPNVTVDEKWRPDRQDDAVDRTIRLTERALADTRPDLVVWPETALPGSMSAHPRWRAGLVRLTRASGTHLVVGATTADTTATGPRRTNAALSFAPSSTFDDADNILHHKQKLVPFVERVRTGLLDLSRDRAGGVEAGEEIAPSDGPLGRYGAVICFELTFPELPRTLRKAGAEMLVVLSNDAWLGPGAGPEQHFAHAALRAVENRMPVVRSANTGVSGIVDPLGRVVTRTASFEETYAAGDVFHAAVVPPAVRYGALGGPGALLGVLLLLGASRRTSVRPGRPRS